MLVVGDLLKSSAGKRKRAEKCPSTSAGRRRTGEPENGSSIEVLRLSKCVLKNITLLTYLL